jgi:hypothetical protein
MLDGALARQRTRDAGKVGGRETGPILNGNGRLHPMLLRLASAAYDDVQRTGPPCPNDEQSRERDPDQKGSQKRTRAVNDANWNGEGDFEPPKPVSQFNGLANRLLFDANTNSKSGLRHINDDLSTSLPTDSCNINPRLTEIIHAWDRLPEPVKAGILSMVRNAL